MIISDLSCSQALDSLGNRFAKALSWLRGIDPATLPDGKTIIQGDELFALAFRGAVKEMEQVKWEAHRRYADIQYVVLGQERMLWQSLACSTPGEYLAEKDFLPLNAEPGADFLVPAGRLAIFFPDDAHRPGIAVPGSGPVFKLVVKILL